MTTFRDLGLSPMILQALEEIGFETPTTIQSKTIPHLINSDNDLVALAQTGTGKTAAFSLPIIQQLSDSTDAVQALILCPTRELAIQVASDIGKFVRYLSAVSVTAVYGGESIEKQIKALKKRPQIVVGTPGRVNDMIKRRVLKVGALKWLVLDEADEMLNMGFKEELDAILEGTPDTKQSLLFSATMDAPVRRIASNYMNKPEDITVGEKNKGADNVDHFYYIVHEKDRYQALRRIADVNPDIHGIVFCRTRHETQQVADKLIQDHYSAEAIHGEISQTQRTHVMNRFKNKKIQLLVATDVAARGIDVDKLTHVINYNLPDSLEAYVHRSGRTGRAHNSGISLVIVNMREKYKIKILENKIGKSFEQARIPGGEDICEKQLFSLVDKVCNVEVNEAQIGKYLDLIKKKFDGMDRDELIKRFVSEEFNRFLEYYKGAVDLNTNVREGKERSGKPGMLFARFRINLGKNERFGMKDLFALLNEQPDLKGVEIGNIDINKAHTIFEVDQNYKDKVLEAFSGLQISCEATGLQSTRAPKREGGRGGRGGSGRRGRPRRNPGKGGGNKRRRY